MNKREVIKSVSIAFGQFLTDDCFFNITGYVIRSEDIEDEQDYTEYEVDELFDYWFDNIYLKSLKDSN